MAGDADDEHAGDEEPGKLPPAGSGVYRGPGQMVTGGRWDVTVDVARGGERLGSRQFALVAK